MSKSHNNCKTFLPLESKQPVEIACKEEIENKVPFYVFPTLKTEYMLVYGTLRSGAGNYNRFLRGHTKHVGVYRVRGFKKSLGISTQYSGHKDDYTVMDLFRITGGEKTVNFVNKYVDMLEGIPYGYSAMIVPIELEDGSTVLAKFYELTWSTSDDQRSVSEDYFGRNRLPHMDEQDKAGFKKRFPIAYEFYFGDKEELPVLDYSTKESTEEEPVEEAAEGTTEEVATETVEVSKTLD